MRKDAAEDSGHSDAVIQLCSGDAFSQLCVLCALGFRRLTGLRLNHASLNLILAFLYVVQKRPEWRVWHAELTVESVMPTLSQVCGSGTCIVKMGPERWWIVSSDPRAVNVYMSTLIGRPITRPAAPRGPLRYSAWTTSIHSRYYAMDHSDTQSCKRKPPWRVHGAQVLWLVTVAKRAVQLHTAGEVWYLQLLIVIDRLINWFTDWLIDRFVGHKWRNNHAIVDSNFASGAATWRTRRNICVVIDSGPVMAPLCENMTSSTKSEVNNLSWEEYRAMTTGTV